MLKNIFSYSSNVEKYILSKEKPIVALESTIITHGMPYPENLAMVKRVEEIILLNGAIPATIAIMDGKIKIGLEFEELEKLAQSKDAIKVSTRDIAYALSKKLYGATTVASTSYLASKAGIRVFVTGGIGGVHREVNDTLDISNDLDAMGEIKICVVSAGVKSILDIPKTLEYLETKGVLVMAYLTDHFPAFYSRQSGSFCLKAENLQIVSEIMYNQFDLLDINKSILLANPVKEEDSIPYDNIKEVIDKAIAEAQEKKIIGKNITPFLLAKISELTNKKSLETNIKLIYNNAEVGAQLAVEYHKLMINEKIVN
jgi:pseudouridine-5'-phosphate glycosidase